MKHVISNSPNILTDPWESVMEKIKYIDEVRSAYKPIDNYIYLFNSFLHNSYYINVIKRILLARVIHWQHSENELQ